VVKSYASKKRGWFIIEFGEVTVAAMDWTISSYIMRNAIESDIVGSRGRN
jgi:hypothetical protein